MNTDRWLQPRLHDVASSAATHGRTFSLPSPVTHDSLADIPDCGPNEADRAVASAHNAFPAWRDATPYDRAAVLMRWHAAIDAEREALADLITLEMGKPIRESRGEVAAALQTIEWSAEEATRMFGATIPSRHAGKHLWTVHQPMGVAYGITPWNFPVAMIARKAAPALATGCTMILKPAEQTPLCALALGALWHEAGGPNGTLQVLPTSEPGRLTDAVLAHAAVRKVTFTGSTAVGRRLYAKAAEGLRRVSLELGGHAPFVVFSDADLDRAVDALLSTKFGNAGQKCISTNRLLVERSVVEELLERLTARLSELRMGDPRKDDIDVGPLVNARAVQKVSEHLEDALATGAHVHFGGTIGHGYVQPTVLTGVTDAMRVAGEETFGPLLPITAFDNDDDAFTAANRTPFGLAGYVFTRDVGRVHRAAQSLDVGILGINDIATVESQAPFGGMKDSGVGREGGRWGLESFTETKYVSLTYA